MGCTWNTLFLFAKPAHVGHGWFWQSSVSMPLHRCRLWSKEASILYWPKSLSDLQKVHFFWVSRSPLAEALLVLLVYPAHSEMLGLYFDAWGRDWCNTIRLWVFYANELQSWIEPGLKMQLDIGQVCGNPFHLNRMKTMFQIYLLCSLREEVSYWRSVSNWCPTAIWNVFGRCTVITHH